MGQREPRGVPDLVAEIAADVERLFEILVVELEVGTHPEVVHESEAQRICAEEARHLQRIDSIPQRFGHAPAPVIADGSVEIDFPERHLTHELDSGHDHAGDPEEQDLRRGHERVPGIERLEALGLVGPAQCTEGPERRGEPSIEDIRILLEIGRAALAAFGGLLDPREGRTAGAVPDGDAVPPPELA